MACPAKGTSRKGFSLIEALVALAIASFSLMAIFELQIQMARGQERAARAVEQVNSQENALALIAHINFTERPEGSVQIPDGDLIRWTSEPLTPLKPNAGYPSGWGMFDVQLHRVSVVVEREGRPSPTPLVIERLGWRRNEIPD